MAKLEVGEKYLTVLLFGGKIKVNVFANKNKKTGKEPDFVGFDGVSVYVNEKKAEEKAQIETQKI